MKEEIVALSIPIFVTLGAFIMVIFIRKFMNDERLAMIERGMNPNLAKPRFTPFNTLRFALGGIGAGVGLFIATMISLSVENLSDEIATGIYFSLILIFGGAGLLIAYFMQLKQDAREREQEKRETLQGA